MRFFVAGGVAALVEERACHKYSSSPVAKNGSRELLVFSGPLFTLSVEMHLALKFSSLIIALYKLWEPQFLFMICGCESLCKGACIGAHAFECSEFCWGCASGKCFSLLQSNSFVVLGIYCRQICRGWNGGKLIGRAGRGR